MTPYRIASYSILSPVAEQPIRHVTVLSILGRDHAVLTVGTTVIDITRRQAAVILHNHKHVPRDGSGVVVRRCR